MITRVVFWGAAGAGKSALAQRLLALRHASAAGDAPACVLPPATQLADLFEGEVDARALEQGSRGAASVVIVVDALGAVPPALTVYARVLGRLGASRVAVAVNRLDLARDAQVAYAAACRGFLRSWPGRTPVFAPVSAVRGDGVPALAALLRVWTEGIAG